MPTQTEEPTNVANASSDHGVIGLRHIHLRVGNVPVATAFYVGAFHFRVGLSVHDGAMVFLQTQGGDDLLTLSSLTVPSELDGRTDQPVGTSGGLDHFGIRVADGATLARVLEQVTQFGGTVLSSAVVHGAPTAFVRDPDGYALQVYVMPSVES